MNTNFKVIGLTRLGIKPKSTAPEADALTTRHLICSEGHTSKKDLNGRTYPFFFTVIQRGVTVEKNGLRLNSR